MNEWQPAVLSNFARAFDRRCICLSPLQVSDVVYSLDVPLTRDVSAVLCTSSYLFYKY